MPSGPTEATDLAPATNPWPACSSRTVRARVAMIRHPRHMRVQATGCPWGRSHEQPRLFARRSAAHASSSWTAVVLEDVIPTRAVAMPSIAGEGSGDGVEAKVDESGMVESITEFLLDSGSQPDPWCTAQHASLSRWRSPVRIRSGPHLMRRAPPPGRSRRANVGGSPAVCPPRPPDHVRRASRTQAPRSPRAAAGSRRRVGHLTGCSSASSRCVRHRGTRLPCQWPDRGRGGHPCRSVGVAGRLRSGLRRPVAVADQVVVVLARRPARRASRRQPASHPRSRAHRPPRASRPAPTRCRPRMPPGPTRATTHRLLARPTQRRRRHRRCPWTHAAYLTRPRPRRQRR